MPLQVVTFIIGTIVIVIGAYYVTYFIGRRASGRSRGRLRNRNINVVDRFAISKDKSFCLVEIAGKVYVVGITNQSMTLIDTLDAATFTEAEAAASAERQDSAVWPVIPGGRLVNRLSYFLAGKMGNPRAAGGGGMGSGTFADVIKTAREKNVSGQPAGKQDERPDDPEGEA